MFRLVAGILFEIFVVFLLEGAGRIILGSFRLKTEPSERTCVVVGLVAWVALIAAVVLWRSLSVLP
ncbi:MAG TPA: hypothetical protein DC063_01295 [Arenimonas sp.]|nr:MAG: hypothetical protein A2X76_07410 [Xanthomonadales bacterium GWF1_69_6]HBD18856.1 hypothetical protein [Arenimonas sp.]